jgi:hypothetical protein
MTEELLNDFLTDETVRTAILDPTVSDDDLIRDRQSDGAIAVGEVRATLRAASAASRDGYAPALAKLRSAAESSFAQEWKAQRLRDLEAEAARRPAPPEPRLTAAELKSYAAPNSYQIAIDAMRKR